MTVLLEKSVTTLEDGIENLLESAKTDYINRYGDDVNSDVAKTMIDRFNYGFVVKSGQKYIKIMLRIMQMVLLSSTVLRIQELGPRT